ncbi:MarR family winged helix-turn-helix transcriptional regulator [Nonomuraea sp. MCN248]|uniref:MarR family winged helix-turn-helix transcriptional regulator n=1 Tax=Nonomuraea corallina TaxID=2989783 RepID=A0ABT4S976_9ACTN|nr:MarR family winged helix-turn-helix transcriptional regulator [Nonomuraea corallina]MDA0633530.1 MarR family winged helix-turn-helix transcriptional regulator [Nonomuraea corallina]
MTATTASELAAWRAYSTAHDQLTAHLSRELARATGLSEADYRILDALLDAPGGRMRALELRWVLQWEKSRLSHQVGRMARRGLLGRESCAEDARGWDITLTPEGREAGARARLVREHSVRRTVLEALGPDRLAQLAETAALLSARLERVAEEDPSCRAARAEAFPEASEDPGPSPR